jgi:hypothetical protein
MTRPVPDQRQVDCAHRSYRAGVMRTSSTEWARAAKEAVGVQGESELSG